MDKKKNDPKYIGVPNICFSLTKPDDSREKAYSKQRIEKGFDDSETWSLRDTIANFILPRLEAYEEIANDYLKRDKKLVKKINNFKKAMKLVVRDDGMLNLNKKEEKQLKKGLKAFPEIFMTLWW